MSYPLPSGPNCGWYNLDGVEEIWLVKDLWSAAEGIIPMALDVTTLEEVHDSHKWLCHWRDLTHPSVERELERVIAADLSYPVILHPEGWLMDGYHRVAKVLMSGGRVLQAVKFTPDTLPLPWDE